MIDKQYIINLIEKSRAAKNIPKMAFYKLIGMTSKGYNQSWKNNSMKVETLDVIATVLDVPLNHFFSPESTSVVGEPDENGYTQQLQEKLIALYEDQKVLYQGQKELYERLVASESEKVALLKSNLFPGGLRDQE